MRNASQAARPTLPHLSTGFAVANTVLRIGFASTSETIELISGYSLSSAPIPAAAPRRRPQGIALAKPGTMNLSQLKCVTALRRSTVACASSMRSTSARTINSSLRSARRCGALKSLAIGRRLRNAFSEWTWLMVDRWQWTAKRAALRSAFAEDRAVFLELVERGFEDHWRVVQAAAGPQRTDHRRDRVDDRDARERLPPVSVPEGNRDQRSQRDQRHRCEHHGGQPHEEHYQQPVLFFGPLDADQFEPRLQDRKERTENAPQWPAVPALRFCIDHGFSVLRARMREEGADRARAPVRLSAKRTGRSTSRPAASRALSRALVRYLRLISRPTSTPTPAAMPIDAH